MANGKSRGIRSAQLGLLANAGLAVVKILAGVVGNSYALVADGIESTADLLSSTVVWSGLRIAEREPDPEYPFGYGKAETLATAMVALMLIAAAIAITIEAVREIITPHHSPAPWTLAVLVVVVIVKEVLFRRIRRVGREVGSEAVHADAWHHRSDAITSVAAFVGISVAVLGGPGWEAADDWAALLAAGIIAWNGQLVLRPALAGLMDQSAGPELRATVHAVATSVDRVRAVEKVIVRRVGADYFADLHVQADPDLSLRDAHELSHNVKDAIMARLQNVRDVLIHMEPYEGEARGAGHDQQVRRPTMPNASASAGSRNTSTRSQ
ncbi:MAG TPA: cation diffusion facilitator family transporter [Gemmatimonadaceae bacterium]